MNSLPLLIDYDGVIKTGNKPAPHVKEFFSYLSKNNLPSYIISNSTLRTGEEIQNFFKEHGIETGIGAMTAADATVSFIKGNYKRAAVFCKDSIKNLFGDILDYENPDVVVIGDLGKDWSYEVLNHMFRYVKNGADLVAMQMNKFWAPEDELCLDAGAFISAIEYASDTKAVLVGKPSALYFQSALEKLGYNKESEFLMLGDDIDSDIGGAQNAGGKGILIFSGKTTEKDLRISDIKPDYTARDLNDVIGLLEKINS